MQSEKTARVADLQENLRLRAQTNRWKQQAVESKHLLHKAHGLLVSGKLEDQVEFKAVLGEYLGRDQHGIT